MSLNRLSLKVKQDAEALGHTMKPFTPMIIDNATHSTCEKCGAYTTVLYSYRNREWITTQKPTDRIAKKCERGNNEPA